MIVIYHSNAKIREVLKDGNQKIDFDSQSSLAKGLYNIAKYFPDEKIVWCHLDCKANLNLEGIVILFHHNQLMLSFNPNVHSFLGREIGYVEQSPFIKINKYVTYPTWQMSSAVGVIHASVLITLKDSIPLDTDFDYYLNSVAKLAMPLGLICYSEPQLLSGSNTWVTPKASNCNLFKFVKQHYKTRWVFLLFLNLFLYERKVAVFPFIFSFFYFKRKLKINFLDDIYVQSTKETVALGTIDVIIPTIGRKQYLYDVLQDLAKQTHLPEKVIIVEQNPLESSISELDYLNTENWPFAIKHIFTHQAGACNARNLALAEVESEWVFLADDDNRFDATLLSDIFFNIKKYGVESITTAYPQVHEFHYNKNVMQSLSFGAGNSFIKSKFINTVQFNRGYEFGYGEDNDFGMQLRNRGVDVLYVPNPKIVHLKAPIGGFRTKPVLQWQSETIQPKPSPTVMLYQLLHQTKEQRLGYKTTLFFKFYSKQTIKNPLRYLISFKKQWNQSMFWVTKLKK